MQLQITSTMEFNKLVDKKNVPDRFAAQILECFTVAKSGVAKLAIFKVARFIKSS